jgi:hypothetical protein
MGTQYYLWLLGRPMDQRAGEKNGVIVVCVGNVQISGALVARATSARKLAIMTTTGDVKFYGFSSTSRFVLYLVENISTTYWCELEQ